MDTCQMMVGIQNDIKYTLFEIMMAALENQTTWGLKAPETTQWLKNPNDMTAQGNPIEKSIKTKQRISSR